MRGGGGGVCSRDAAQGLLPAAPGGSCRTDAVAAGGDTPQPGGDTPHPVPGHRETPAPVGQMCPQLDRLPPHQLCPQLEAAALQPDVPAGGGSSPRGGRGSHPRSGDGRAGRQQLRARG